MRDLLALKHALDESAIVATTDAKGLITSVNERFCRISKYSREELLGQNHRIINSGHHPKGFFQDMWKTIATGNVWHGEIKNRAKDGSFYWVGTTIVPFLNAGGQPWQYMAIRFDITDRKRVEEELKAKHAELEARADALARSNAELEQFAYVASHDLQEPLRMVSLYTQLLAKRYKGKLDPDADDFIRYASEGAQTMVGMIRDLLTYARLGAAAPNAMPVPVDAALDGALLNLRAALDDAQPTLQRGPLPQVPGDLGQFTQLFQNLVGNALKFRAAGRPLHLEIGAEKDAGCWRFWVKDNGIGFNREQAERIFTLFQRLHPRNAFPGNGIGLAFCKRIVERHGGRIWVESAPDSGSTFLFTLPSDRSTP